ncbi:hypothetical protein GCM10010174_25940 [Kutzneria viridogrisea]|uniref:Lsr2 protein n=1 Tax=Kutzneria viridogrisea TaxID=47990 RepID=A0ABR6BRH3_9PSEU|nr:hypothetical protein [Kutzneria viridogrisea]
MSTSTEPTVVTIRPGHSVSATWTTRGYYLRCECTRGGYLPRHQVLAHRFLTSWHDRTPTETAITPLHVLRLRETGAVLAVVLDNEDILLVLIQMAAAAGLRLDDAEAEHLQNTTTRQAPLNHAMLDRLARRALNHVIKSTRRQAAQRELGAVDRDRVAWGRIWDVQINDHQWLRELTTAEVNDLLDGAHDPAARMFARRFPVRVRLFDGTSHTLPQYQLLREELAVQHDHTP